MSKFKRLDSYAQKFKDRSDQGGNVKMWWIPQGESVVRILPAPIGKDPEDFFFPVGVHYKIAGKNMLFCRNLHGFDPPGDCPICEFAKNDELTKDERGNYTPREKCAFYVLVRGSDEPDTPRVMLAPATVVQAIHAAIARVDRYGDVISPKQGRDFIITRTGSGFGTKYYASPDGTESTMVDSPTKAKSILTTLQPLHEVLNVMSLSDINAALDISNDAEDGVEDTGGDTADAESDFGADTWSDLEEDSPVEVEETAAGPDDWIDTSFGDSVEITDEDEADEVEREKARERLAASIGKPRD
jgi:hypothetical protein